MSRLTCSPGQQVWPTLCASRSASDGHILVAPKEHVSTIHVLPIEAQRAVWSLVWEVRRRLRTGLVPDTGFTIGIADGLTRSDGVAHTVIHIIPRRTDDALTLPNCSEWIDDDGVLT